jgi:CDP-glycerol glycerophosphotransferase (TagB/SpsB family)
MKDADVYVCDNSSTIFEFAFLKKPVVLLNNPLYRKNVEHEGNPRFWKYANIGPNVNRPHELRGAIIEALNNYDIYKERRDEALKEVFVYLDGKCADRAAKAIIKHVIKKNDLRTNTDN